MQVTNVRYPKCRGKFSWLLESHPVVSYLCLYREHFSYTAYAYKHSAQGRDRNQKKEKISERFCYYSNTTLSAIELDNWAAIILLTIGNVQPIIDYIQSYT